MITCASSTSRAISPRQLHPSESKLLPTFGLGLTKVVQRATAAAAELTPEELRRGGARVRRQARTYRPGAVCFLGVGAFNGAYARKSTPVGPQDERFEGATLFVLPNPSGLNANYQLPDFVRLFREVREAVGMPSLIDPSSAHRPGGPS
jgi:TDG/mug DNA glycosylase family protein